MSAPKCVQCTADCTAPGALTLGDEHVCCRRCMDLELKKYCSYCGERIPDLSKRVERDGGESVWCDAWCMHGKLKCMYCGVKITDTSQLVEKDGMVWCNQWCVQKPKARDIRKQLEALDEKGSAPKVLDRGGKRKLIHSLTEALWYNMQDHSKRQMVESRDDRTGKISITICTVTVKGVE